MRPAGAHRLRSSCGSARGMRADRGLRRPRGADEEGAARARQPPVDLDDAVDILSCLALADYLNAPAFKQFVETSAIAGLTIDYVISAYCYASKFGACRLLDAAESLIRSQFGRLTNELEWLEQSDIEYFVETNEEHTEIELLRVLLKHVSDEQNIAPRLLASADDLELLARDDNAPIRALSGWRREVLGATALQLKNGEIALAMKNGRLRPITDIEPAA